MIWTISATNINTLRTIMQTTEDILEEEGVAMFAKYEYPGINRYIFLMSILPMWAFGFKLRSDDWSAKADLEELELLIE